MTRRYEVGYRKPPKKAQFQKGRSGNPKGRRKGSRNFNTYFVTILNGRIKVTKDGVARSMSRMEALIETLFVRALKGDTRAFELILRIMQSIGLNDREDTGDKPLSGDEELLLKLFEERVKREVTANVRKAASAEKRRRVAKKRRPTR